MRFMQSLKLNIKWYLLATLFLANFFIWNSIFIETRNKILTVAFLDIGQGDAIFIEAPNGNQVLIDGGANKSVLRQLSKVMPFYDRSIDVVIATHPDKDHIGGVDEILNHYQAKEIWYNGDNDKSQTFQDAWRAIQDEKKDGASILSPVKNQTKIFGLNTFSIVYTGQNPDDDNANSLVAMFSEADWDALFMADLTADFESQIAPQDIEILKVGHHGSKNSTSEWLLDNFQPEIAVISVGKNSYGHPTQIVLDKLADRAIKIHRTDKEGTVKICHQ